MAGSLAGLAGLGVFLLIHQLWIVPIWFIAPVGAVMAGLGGAAVGAAFDALRSHLPRQPWTAVAVAIATVAILSPAVVVAQLRGPTFAMGPGGGGTVLVPATDLVLDVVVGLIGVSAVTGATLGAVIGRSRRAAVATMLAAIAMAVGPGHNIPFLGATPVVAKELAILGAVIAVSALTLVEADAWLRRRSAAASLSQP